MARHSREPSGSVPQCWSPLVSPFSRLFRSSSRNSMDKNSPPLTPPLPSDYHRRQYHEQKAELKEEDIDIDQEKEDEQDEQDEHEHTLHKLPDSHSLSPHSSSIYPRRSASQLSVGADPMTNTTAATSMSKNQHNYHRHNSNNSLRSGRRSSKRHPSYVAPEDDNSNSNNNINSSTPTSPSSRRRSVKSSMTKHMSSTSDQQSVVPRTWSQYDNMYAHGRVDSQPPPFDEDEYHNNNGNNSKDNSPTNIQIDNQTGAQSSKKMTKGFYPPPKPPTEKERLMAVRRLDLFGEYGPPPVSNSRGTQLPDYFPGEEESFDATPTLEDGQYSPQRQLHQKPQQQQQQQSHHNRTPSTDFNKLHINRQSAITTSDHALSQSLSDCPAFRRIVRHARRVFNAKTCMLSVLEDDQQLFLAESGVGEKVIPREISFCAHTILAGNKGFVVLDADKDWRFKSSPVTKELGARFYAGVPLLCPDLTGVDKSGTEYPIGTLCITDPRPRETFTEVERDELHWLASRARAEIEIWYRAREEAKRKLMEAKFAEWKSSNVINGPQSSGRPQSSSGRPRSSGRPQSSSGRPQSSSGRPRSSGRPQSSSGRPRSSGRPQSSGRGARGVGMNEDGVRPMSLISDDGYSVTDYASAVDDLEDRGEFTSEYKFGLDFDEDDEDREERLDGSDDMLSVQGGGGSASSSTSGQFVNPYAQVFDTAVQLIKGTLDLSLVYLVVMDFEDEYAKIESGNLTSRDEPLSIRLDVLAGRGLPDPPPVFDITLHIRALRAPEGGLLYQNEKLLSNDPSDDHPQYELKSDEYASAILVPVDEIESAAKGYVLAAFTKDVRKAFEMEDFTLMRKVASELKPYVDEHASEYLNTQ